MRTEWEDIGNYEGLYKVNSKGEIFSEYTKKILKPIKGSDGYLRVNLSKNGVVKITFIHRLVAEAFIPNPENKPIVNHINGFKDDPRMENLEWVTASGNIKHAYQTGLSVISEKCKIAVSKIAAENGRKTTSKSVNQYTLQGDFIKNYPSVREAERETGTPRCNIFSVCKGKRKQANGYMWSYREAFLNEDRVFYGNGTSGIYSSDEES
ncbi:MAG: NUMOD4 domain-containing protein [Desulfitobacterium hafniense]|nr:NUMOD4 domain-containing protein [Desulfitobacterium hafniense]